MSNFYIKSLLTNIVTGLLQLRGSIVIKTESGLADGDLSTHVTVHLEDQGMYGGKSSISLFLQPPSGEKESRGFFHSLTLKLNDIADSIAMSLSTTNYQSGITTDIMSGSQLKEPTEQRSLRFEIGDGQGKDISELASTCNAGPVIRLSSFALRMPSKIPLDDTTET